LPRKFKIAVNGAAKDRSATQVHDIGLQLVRNDDGITGFDVIVGGGLGRTPMIGVVIRPFLEKPDLLSYLEAILRVYNRFGRRDNKYKARIKILVKELGTEEFTRLVETEWAMIRDTLTLDQTEIDRVTQAFSTASYESLPAECPDLEAALAEQPSFHNWWTHNTAAHKVQGYRVVFVSLKPPGQAPGDMTDAQMDALADLTDLYSQGELRVTHTQNLVLADVRLSDLCALWQKLSELNLATANIGTAADIISCPGLDFCSLANATSIAVANGIQQLFENMDYLYDLGDIRINISGCMNGCGHHTVGHIGILGVDKKGEEWYQITLGGSSATEAALGDRLGPAVSRDEIVQVVESLFSVYRDTRADEESFLETVQRVGLTPFQERVYGTH
jgi:sulfite reductase (NADPH) hemoprotein beta-component